MANQTRLDGTGLAIVWQRIKDYYLDSAGRIKEALMPIDIKANTVVGYNGVASGGIATTASYCSYEQVLLDIDGTSAEIELDEALYNRILGATYFVADSSGRRTLSSTESVRIYETPTTPSRYYMAYNSMQGVTGTLIATLIISASNTNTYTGYDTGDIGQD